MVRFVFSALAALVMCSAHAGPTSEQHQQLGLYSGQLRECFERGMVSPRVYADTNQAISTLMDLTGYDRDIVQYAENAGYTNTTAGLALCRQVEASGYAFQSKLQQLEASRRQAIANNNAAVDRSQREIQQYWPQPVQKPIWCNNIGSTVMCQ